MRSKLIFRTLLIAVLAIMPLSLIAKAITAPIAEVTVYPDRAQIVRLARVELPAGDHTLIIENLPAKAFDETFRVSVSDTRGLTLLGFNHRLERHVTSTLKEVADLEAKIDNITKNDLALLKGRKDTFEEQKNLINTLARSSGTSGTGDEKAALDVSQWQTAFDFVGRSLAKINDSIRIVNNQIDEVNKQLVKLQDDLRAINSSRNKVTKTVEIDVVCEEACSFDLALKYVAADAYWSPIYDARFKNDSSIQMLCHANINQQTGEDWNEVKLIVSTARPSANLGPGKIMTWYLSAIEQYYGRTSSAPQPGVVAEMESNVYALEKKAKGVADYEADALDEAMANVGMAAMVGGDNFAVTFNPSGKKTIKSSEQAERFLVADWNLKGKVTYVCRPQNYQQVYRQAEIFNQKNAPIMPGEISVYAGSDFLGKTRFDNFIAPGEKFELAFGAENNIKVERTLVDINKEHNDGIFSGNSIKDERTVKITLKNNGPDEKKIQLEEALPISQDERIKVKFGKIVPEYSFQNEKGRTVWDITLKPGEEKIVTIPIKIEYPNNMTISGL
ncbi:MAG: mucoidy inhibitor MuiA family protein [Candidatus Zixiibacteriota bacterium]